MSTKYLGEQFDIHGGGLDLEFPHHENEIAQTEALTGKKPWVKYWLHNGFVNVNKQKMSKSLGNFFTLKDIFQRYEPSIVRFFLLQTHYRSPINYSDAELDNAKEAYARLTRFLKDVEFYLTKAEPESTGAESDDLADQLALFQDKFAQAMDDDFNTAGALAAIFEMVKYCRKTIDEGERGESCLSLMKKTLQGLLAILGLKLEVAKLDGPQPAEIERLIAERQAARQNKNFPRADQIRCELAEQGIILEDSPEGTRWQVAA
jgi:cysteinyl-tRNA synthetase